MRLIFFGSGPFGLPTLRQLASAHDVVLVVSQPDRPAGRHRHPTPTPIAAVAEEFGIETCKPEDVNDPAVVERIRAAGADAFVVIAFGQKLGRPLLADVFAINLHASLLPKYRGAAPINWAMMNGESETGVSVITLADRMDAGVVLARSATPIQLTETAGELHDRLARMGPRIIVDVLKRFAAGVVQGIEQDERQVTHAPKLTKADGTVRFDQPAAVVRQRVHGLTPWPGCRVKIGDAIVRLSRVEDDPEATGGEPGEILADGSIACASGSIRVLEIQPPGGRVMDLASYRNGRAYPIGSKVQSL